MKRLHILFFFIFAFFAQNATAQGYAFGVKGGLAIGQQKWNTGGASTNNLLFKYQGSVFIESVSAADKGQSVLFAEAGYHTRGSAFRYRSGAAYDPNGILTQVDGFTEEFIFKNVGLILGAKRRGVLGKEKAFFTVGIRGEYTVGTNLESAERNTLFVSSYPQKEFVRKLQYGLSISGGYEFPFSELVGGFVEFSVHPDLSLQYFRPQFPAFDPYQRINIIVPEQGIRNTSFELTIGFRFLKKIEYID
jgi:Outer membrane protein beta-barrel domain